MTRMDAKSTGTECLVHELHSRKRAALIRVIRGFNCRLNGAISTHG